MFCDIINTGVIITRKEKESQTQKKANQKIKIN
jgi:hypothetical protein